MAGNCNANNLKTAAYEFKKLYFKYIDENNKDKIKEISFNKAFNDATMRKALANKTNYNLFELKAKLRLKLFSQDSISNKQDIDNLINDLFGIADKHNENKYKQEAFTYGNTQKLVNMYFKYLYCFNDRFQEFFKDEIKFFYCPIDSIIAGQIIRDCVNVVDKQPYCFETSDLGGLKLLKDISTYSGTARWSQLCKNEYDIIQTLLSKLEMGLKYDFINWKKDNSKQPTVTQQYNKLILKLNNDI